MVKKKSKISKKFVLAPVIIFTLAFIGLRASSAIHYIRPFVDTLTPIFSKSLASYNEKMSVKYPVYYDFVNEVKLTTPEGSTIYIPDIEIPYGEIMWPISNLQICSAFLYPRIVAYFQQDSTEDLRTGSYIVITHGFPEVIIKSEEVYIIKGKNIKVVEGDYNPKNFNYDDNGLIKL